MAGHFFVFGRARTPACGCELSIGLGPIGKLAGLKQTGAAESTRRTTNRLLTVISSRHYLGATRNDVMALMSLCLGVGAQFRKRERLPPVFPRFNAPAAPNRAAAADVLLVLVDDRRTGNVVEWQVNATSTVARATDNSVQENHHIVRPVVADSIGDEGWVVFANGSSDSPFISGDLNRVWIAVGCEIQVNGKTIKKQFGRNTLRVKSFGINVFRDPRLSGQV